MMNAVTVGAVIAVLLLVLAAVAAVLLVRRVVRALGRHRATLTLQAALAPSPSRREVLRLRLRLQDEVTGVRRALRTLAVEGGATGELPRLARGIERSAAALDAQLRLLADEPHPGTVQELLPGVRSRAERLMLAAQHLRRAVFGQLGGWTAVDLDDLTAEVEREVEALASGMEAFRALAAGEPRGFEVPITGSEALRARPR
jgi:hypothetical protein